MFIYFERERRERENASGEGAERIPSRLHAVSAEPDTEIDLMNWETMT